MSHLSFTLQLFQLERRVRRLARSISAPIRIPSSYRKSSLVAFWLLCGMLVLSSLVYAQAPVQMKGRDLHYRGDPARMYAQQPSLMNGRDMDYRAESSVMYAQEPPVLYGREQQQQAANPAQRIAQRTSPYVVGVISGRGKSVENVGSGIVLNSNGVVITSYQLVKDATALRVHLGEKNYDQVVLLAYNEVRDLAALRIADANLTLPPTRSSGFEADEQVYVVWKEPSGEPGVALGALKTSSPTSDGTSQPTLLEFVAALESPARGAALVDQHGNVLGMVTGTASKDGFYRAVPMTALLHFSAFSGRIFEPGSELRLPGGTDTGTDSLHNVQPAKLGNYNRTFAVNSETVLIPRDHMLQALRNNRDFAALDLVILESSRAAEVFVEVNHIPWTFDYTFKAIDQRTSTVIGAGRVTAFNGYLAAPQLADKIAAQMKAWKSTVKVAEKK